MRPLALLDQIPVWAFLSGTRELVRLGTIAVDRERRPWTYTVQHESDSTDWPSEVDAADWLQTADGRAIDFVVVGRVFRPEWSAKVTSPRHAMAR